MSNEKKYCCQPFFEAVNGVPELGIHPFVVYTPKWRSYGVIIKTSPDSQWVFSYCPFCGQKMLEDLVYEYDSTIRDSTGKVLNPLPEEFETDLWWKKRGL